MAGKRASTCCRGRAVAPSRGLSCRCGPALGGGLARGARRRRLAMTPSGTAANLTLRVLVVDDDPLARARIVEALASEPALRIVGECGDGPSAVEGVLACAPDLVLLDVQMPGFDGFEVVQRVGPRGCRRSSSPPVRRICGSRVRGVRHRLLAQAVRRRSTSGRRRAGARATGGAAAGDRRAGRGARRRGSVARRRRHGRIGLGTATRRHPTPRVARAPVAPRPTALPGCARRARECQLRRRPHRGDQLVRGGGQLRAHSWRRQGAAGLQVAGDAGAGGARSRPLRQVHRSAIVNVATIRSVEPLFHGDLCSYSPTGSA
jgi:CheY-like chemotaxis protein